jgi:hypothetical protein
MLSPLTITSLDQGPKHRTFWDDRSDAERILDPDVQKGEAHPRPSLFRWFIRRVSGQPV